MSLKALSERMVPQHEFEEAFQKELSRSYAQASEANAVNDDRQVVINLAQAEVWAKLLRIISGK